MAADTLILFYGTIFLGTLFFIEAVYYIVFGTQVQRKAVNIRMKLLGQQKDNVKVYRSLKRMGSTDWLAHLGPIGYIYCKVDDLITQSGMKIKTGQFFLLCGGLTIISFLLIVNKIDFDDVITSLMVSPILLVFALLMGVGLPILWLQHLRKKRKRLFNEQLPDAIDVIIRSLKAGHPINAAMELVSQEMADPLGTEFGLAVDEMTYGLELRDALENLADRIELSDLEFLVVSIGIQYETGGNLAEILGGISSIVRDRFSLERKVKALSAEGRISALLLAVMPVITVVGILAGTPDFYKSVIDDPLFLPIAGGILALFVIGNYIMYRLVNFRF